MNASFLIKVAFWIFLFQNNEEKLKQHYDIEVKIKDGMFVDIFREIETKNYQ